MSAEAHVPAETSAEDAAKTLDEIRLAQAKRIGRAMAVFVALPTLLVLLYDVAIATKQYQAEATITLDAGAGTEGASPGSPLARDVLMLESFLESRDLVRELAAAHRLREHYGAASVDFLSRYRGGGSIDALTRYFDDHLDVDFDPERAFITVRVRAFSGADAERIVRAVIAIARAHVERFVAERRDGVLLRTTRDALEAASLLGDARAAFVAASPAPTVAPDAGVADASASAASDAPAAAPPSASANPIVERARAAVELAESRVVATRSALDAARADTVRLERRVLVVAEPVRPDLASLPRPLRDTLTVLLGSLALLVIGSIVISTIKEHV